jgi:hypothetical protein
MEGKMDGMKNKMDGMENKMEENKIDIKTEMKNMSPLIFQAIDGRFPKGDIKMEWNHENNGSNHVE